MSLGERIKEERARLELTQEAFAVACDTNKRQQIKYEKDEQAPGAAYLAGACRAGVDVPYVLTGIRTGEVDPKESALLAAYRGASEELQRAALSVLGVAAATPTRGGKAKVSIRENEIGQQISTGGKVRLKDFTINVGGGKK